MRWQKKLTKKELDHIKDITSRATQSEFWANREVQLAGGWNCLGCQAIAKKLLARVKKNGN